MGLSWGLGYFYTLSIFEKYQIDTKNLNLLFLGLFTTAWIGAKVFFLWFSSGPKLYQYLYANYFWLGGGFVFYGGLIFGLLFYFIWSLLLKKFDIKNSKYLLPGLVFGHAVGRIGCFLTGCCYGSKALNFFTVNVNGEDRYPVQLIESISLFLIGFVILNLLKKKISNIGTVSFYLISYSVVRFLLEYMRGDEIRGIIISDLSSSQLISICIFVVTLLFNLLH